MTARQQLDRTVLQITGKDIRLIGNWQKLDCLANHSPEIAQALGVDQTRLGECDDITDILLLIGKARPAWILESATPSLFAQR